MTRPTPQEIRREIALAHATDLRETPPGQVAQLAQATMGLRERFAASGVTSPVDAALGGIAVLHILEDHLQASHHGLECGGLDAMFGTCASIVRAEVEP